MCALDRGVGLGRGLDRTSGLAVGRAPGLGRARVVALDADEGGEIDRLLAAARCARENHDRGEDGERAHSVERERRPPSDVEAHHRQAQEQVAVE